MVLFKSFYGPLWGDHVVVKFRSTYTITSYNYYRSERWTKPFYVEFVSSITNKTFIGLHFMYMSNPLGVLYETRTTYP